MSMRARLERMFPNGIPEYLLKALGLRESAEERRRRELREAEEKVEAEFHRKRNLRRPPARVWLQRVGTKGMEVHWEPPETADELPPTGYIVGGDTDSSKLLPPEYRWQFLRIYEPGNRITVEADYSGYQITRLGEAFITEAE